MLQAIQLNIVSSQNNKNGIFMAGGAQLIISAQGITLKTANTFKVLAGQHQFEAGEAVAITQTVLANSTDSYSNQFNYVINSAKTCVNYSFKAFVLDQAAGKLLACNTPNQTDLSSQRFHTPEPQAVIGLLALSDQITAQQNNHIEHSDISDPLLDEALNANLNLSSNLNDGP